MQRNKILFLCSEGIPWPQDTQEWLFSWAFDNCKEIEIEDAVVMKLHPVELEVSPY